MLTVSDAITASFPKENKVPKDDTGFRMIFLCCLDIALWDNDYC